MDIIANGSRFRVIESGSGTPVICIHGNGLNRLLWRHLEPELSRKYRTIVYELRGMGKSETVGKPGSKFTVRDHADDLGAVMDALGIEQAAIVGQGFGSFLSLQFAADQPHRVSAMVAVNTSARLEGMIRQEVPRWVETAEREGMEPLIEGALNRWFVESFRQARPEIMDLYRKMIGANPPLGYAANCRGIMELDIRDDLTKIQCPTLLVTGEADRSTPVRDHEIIAERIADSELVVVEDASHTVCEEQPEEFNRIVLEFLGRNL